MLKRGPTGPTSNGSKRGDPFDPSDVGTVGSCVDGGSVGSCVDAVLHPSWGESSFFPPMPGTATKKPCPCACQL